MNWITKETISFWIVFYFPGSNVIRLFNLGLPDMLGDPPEPRPQCPTCTESGNN